jgi:hypothetical protein
MYLTIPSNKFEINNIIISDKSKNNVIENSFFTVYTIQIILYL